MRRSAARLSLRYGALVLSTLGVALVGYAGFVLYFRLDVPAGLGAGLLVLAVGAGIASFFSPCSFPLLVSILGRPIALEEKKSALATAIPFAFALSLGAATFLLLFGLLVAFAGATLFEDVGFTSRAGRAIRIAVGVLLIVLGLIQLNRIRVSFRRFEPTMHAFLKRQAVLRRRRPFVGFAVFGFGYLAAGFG